MASKKTDFTKLALETMQAFRDLSAKSKMTWSDAYYEATFVKIGRALENGRQSMEELASGHAENRSGVALRKAVEEIQGQNKMFAHFFSHLNDDAAKILESRPDDMEKIEHVKHELIVNAGVIYSSMQTVLDDMEKHLPKRQKPRAMQV